MAVFKPPHAICNFLPSPAFCACSIHVFLCQLPLRACCAAWVPPAPTRARLRTMGQRCLLQLHQDLSGSWGHLLLTQSHGTVLGTGWSQPKPARKTEGMDFGRMIKGYAVEATHKAHQGGLSCPSCKDRTGALWTELYCLCWGRGHQHCTLTLPSSSF